MKKSSSCLASETLAGLPSAAVECVTVVAAVTGFVGALKKLLKMSPTTSAASDLVPFVDDGDEDDVAEEDTGEPSPSRSAEPEDTTGATGTLAAGTVLDSLGLCVGFVSAIGTDDLVLVGFLSVGRAESNTFALKRTITKYIILTTQSRGGLLLASLLSLHLLVNLFIPIHDCRRARHILSCHVFLVLVFRTYETLQCRIGLRSSEAVGQLGLVDGAGA